MIFRKILSYWKSFVVDEEQAMAILVDLHVITCTNPGSMLNLCFFVRIESTWAQRPT